MRYFAVTVKATLQVQAEDEDEAEEHASIILNYQGNAKGDIEIESIQEISGI